MRANPEPESRAGIRHGRAFGAIARPSAILVLLLFLVACGYAPGDVANPLTRKFTWVSYLGGDDIRAGCVAGAPDRFRLIYNGIWREQARVYELGFTGPRSLDQRVIGPGQLFAISIADPLGPWRGASATTVLTQGAYAGLLASLEQSGAFTSSISTLTLKSTDFYWAAASCHAGTFHLTAWLYPSTAFDRLSFPQKLLALDTTHVPFNPPRPWTEVASAPLGTADNPARGGRGRTDWSVGIANDQLVDQVIF